MKKMLVIGLLAIAFTPLFGQDIPYDVFYLMPQMGKGTLLFKDKSPINGTFNICAVDNTVRFLDKDGTELAMNEDPSLVSVIIDNVPFLLKNGEFYRLELISGDIYVAVKRKVNLLTDTTESAYGMESQTTAVTNFDTMQSSGRLFRFGDTKGAKYTVSESASLYWKGKLLSPNKKNFIKCFPDKKADIEQWFAAHKKVDGDQPEKVIELAKMWG